MDAAVRRVQAMLPAVIVSVIALYFAVVFILAGAKTLLLLYEGTIDYAIESLAQAVGYAFGPSFAKPALVAAAVGAIKLAVGGFFALAVIERVPAGTAGEKEFGALDFALHGAVALTLLQVLPAWIAEDGATVRVHTAHVLLLCVAIGTSMFEREHAERGETGVGEFEDMARYHPRPERPLPTGRMPLR